MLAIRMSLFRLVPDWKCAIANPAERAVRPNDPVGVIVLAANRLQPHAFGNMLAVVGMDRIHPGARLCIQGVARATPRFFIRGTDIVYQSCLRIRQPKDCADILGHLAKSVPAFAQGFLCLLAS